MQIIDDGEKEDRIDQYTDHLAARDVFKISGEVTRDGIDGECQYRPTDRRPEQLWTFIQPKPRTPEHQHSNSQSLNDKKFRSPHRAESQRGENQNPQYQS